MSKLVIGVSQCLLETCVYSERCRADSRQATRPYYRAWTWAQKGRAPVLIYYTYIYIFLMYTQIVFSLESIKKLINLQSIKNTYST